MRVDHVWVTVHQHGDGPPKIDGVFSRHELADARLRGSYDLRIEGPYAVDPSGTYYSGQI